jgi:transposase
MIVLDSDNQAHFCDVVLHFRTDMLSRNLKLFYLPPGSNQMNLLEWVLPAIKKRIMFREYATLEDLKR